MWVVDAAQSSGAAGGTDQAAAAAGAGAGPAVDMGYVR